MSAIHPSPRFVLQLVGAMIYGAAGLAFVYAALNDLLQGRAGLFEMIGGALGVTAVAIAGVYLFRLLEDESDRREGPGT